MKTLLLLLALSGAALCCAAEKTEMIPADGAKTGATIVRVTAPLSETHGVSPILGRDFVPADFKTPTAVVISSEFWKTGFAARVHVIGQKMKVSGQEFTIVGIMPDKPAALAGRILWLAEPK